VKKYSLQLATYGQPGVRKSDPRLARPPRASPRLLGIASAACFGAPLGLACRLACCVLGGNRGNRPNAGVIRLGCQPRQRGNPNGTCDCLGCLACVPRLRYAHDMCMPHAHPRAAHTQRLYASPATASLTRFSKTHLEATWASLFRHGD
jgi:hypothetical protein